jgi:histidinol-phosphatase (PHP family)
MIVPILYDSHMHTPFCKHAWGEPEQYAATAESQNLKGIIITCHCPGPEGWSPKVRMSMSQFDEYVASVEEAASQWAGRIDIRLGLECDYMPGIATWLGRFLDQVDLQYVIGSVHPQLPYYKELFHNSDPIAYQRKYFEHLAMAAESGLFDCLGHPDLVKNCYPSAWDVTAVLDDIRACLDRVAKSGTALELNTSGLLKEVKEMNPNPAMLAEMSQRNIPVVLGSDAHAPHRVGADFTRGLDLLQEAGYEEVNVFLGRQSQAISLEQARLSLKNNRANRSHPDPR